MQNKMEIIRFIEKTEEGSYFGVPFDVPENVEKIDIHYSYARHAMAPVSLPLAGEAKQEINVIDLALSSPVGFVGASGSNRQHIWVAANNSSAGFGNAEILSGQWQIMAGAYKVQAEGVPVKYTIEFTLKKLRRFIGDTHLHTVASDGKLTFSQICAKAKQQELDYIILADHNNFAQNFEITGAEGLTVIPGCEFTNYNGHCNLIGVKKPLQKNNPVLVNSQQEFEACIKEAVENGALVSINHPFYSSCGWKRGIDNSEYDMVEIWNGGIMPQDNSAAQKWWHNKLLQGSKIVAVGGSDFHNAQPMRELAQPCTAVWAMSASAGDILSALQNGSSYLTINPAGPGVFALCGETTLGGTVTGGGRHTVKVEFTELEKGDVVHIITAERDEEITCEANMASCKLETKVDTAERFVRFEVYRMPWSMLLGGAVMISNPIYFQNTAGQ